MGDWIQVETGKRRTLTGIFVKYICIFCVNTVLLAAFMLLLFNVLVSIGVVLPANYMERQINEKREEIINTKKVTQEMLPVGSRYGVYDRNGYFLYGNFDEKDCKDAWEAYTDNDTFADGGGLYQFLLRENEEICIMRYYIKTQAVNAFFRKYLPAPDICIVLLFIVLFFLQTIVVSKHFATMISKKLKVLNEVTESIQGQDLEIGEVHSDIKEIDEVMTSLAQMGSALKESLDRQWRLERYKREQVAALAHDIKTPLTVIKGNAELLAEEELLEACKEYSGYIRENVTEIEDYLVKLQDMLFMEEKTQTAESISAVKLSERLKERAKELAAGYYGGKIKVEEDREEKDALCGDILCNLAEIWRAWDNIITNALEYTFRTSLSQAPKEKVIRIVMETVEEDGIHYLAARVIDRGKGFTKEELIYASEQFYQGDKSRHEKNHRGLGLYIASQFLLRQGGRLVLENEAEEGYGGRVSLMLKQQEYF